MEASAIQQLKLPDMWLLLALLPASGRLCPGDTACVRGSGISPFALSMRTITIWSKVMGTIAEGVEQLRPEQYYLRGRILEGRSAASWSDGVGNHLPPQWLNSLLLSPLFSPMENKYLTPQLLTKRNVMNITASVCQLQFPAALFGCHRLWLWQPQTVIGLMSFVTSYLMEKKKKRQYQK